MKEQNADEYKLKCEKFCYHLENTLKHYYRVLPEGPYPVVLDSKIPLSPDLPHPGKWANRHFVL
jgi:hypothetical protein